MKTSTLPVNYVNCRCVTMSALAGMSQDASEAISSLYLSDIDLHLGHNGTGTLISNRAFIDLLAKVVPNKHLGYKQIIQAINDLDDDIHVDLEN